MAAFPLIRRRPTDGTISPGGTPGITAAATRAPKPPNLNNQLLLTAANGFTLNLMSGGQFLVNLANSIVFEYSNKGVQVVSPNLTVSFVQPLLRGAWARIVTQGLSLQERNVLYNLRAFAEFRRQFYVSLVASGGVGIDIRVICPSSTSFRTFATSRKTSSFPGRTSRYSRRSSRDRKARSMSRWSQTSTRVSRSRCFSRRRGFRHCSTGSRSVSGCRPRSKCESTIRPWINSS